jgi:hypothetical protein
VSARVRYLCVVLMIAVAALMLCALANAKDSGGGGRAAAHRSESAQGAGEEGPISVSRNPGEPEAEQPHTNALFFNQASGATPASTSGETQTGDGGLAYSLTTFLAVIVLGAIAVKIASK